MPHRFESLCKILKFNAQQLLLGHHEVVKTRDTHNRHNDIYRQRREGPWVRSSPKPCNVTLTTAAHRTSCDGSPLRSSCSVLKPQPSGRSWRSSPRATDTPQRLAQGLQLPIHLTVAAIVTYLL